MGTAVTINQPQDIQTADQVQARIDLIQAVMKRSMKKDTHFGVIPFTQKPTLYKAGSELLLATFHIAVEPEVEDLSTGDEIRYRVRAVGRHQDSGIVLGTGVGEASSNEEKYKWRDAVCDEEYELAHDFRRRIKFQKTRQGVWKRKQIRTEPADVANTILKMAKKRAQIDLTLTALAVSDIFTQDAEDLPEGMEHVAEDVGKPETAAPTAKSDTKLATDKQRGLVKVKLGDLPEADLCKFLEIESIDALPFAKVNAALAWIQEQAA